jgi:uncharacterized protein (DUF1015 family)
MLVNPAIASQVAVPAYDLLSAADRQRILADDSLSFLNAIRLPEDYPRGAERDPDRHLYDSLASLRRMVKEGAFRPVGRPTLFVYRLTARDHRQTAVVAEVPAREYEDGKVLRHEETRAHKQSGLRRYIETVKASSSPVCLTYRPVARIDEVVSTITTIAPDLDFVAHTGTRQEVWVIRDSAIVNELTDLFRRVPRTYITDGHHRTAATASIATDASFLAALFPADQLRLVAIHRCVRDLGPETPAGLLRKLKEEFDIESNQISAEPPIPASGKIVMRLDGQWHRLSRIIARPGGSWQSLDVISLQNQVLAPLLGIDDPRSDPRLACVTSRIAPETIAGWVDSGAYEVAFLLHAMSLEQLMAVSDAGHTLPPKSSWFTPKAGSGIFLRFDDR